MRSCVCLTVSGCERLIFNGADDIKSNGQSAVVLLLLFFPTKLPRSLQVYDHPASTV